MRHFSTQVKRELISCITNFVDELPPSYQTTCWVGLSAHTRKKKDLGSQKQKNLKVGWTQGLALSLPSGFRTLAIAAINYAETDIKVFCHCVKSVHIRSYSGLHFPASRLNVGKMLTRITPNTTLFTQYCPLQFCLISLS